MRPTGLKAVVDYVLIALAVQKKLRTLLTKSCIFSTSNFGQNFWPQLNIKVKQNALYIAPKFKHLQILCVQRSYAAQIYTNSKVSQFVFHKFFEVDVQ